MSAASVTFTPSSPSYGQQVNLLFMKKLVYLLFAALPSLVVAQTSVTRSVDAFTGINTSALVSIELKSGSPCAVTLEGEEESVKTIVTKVENGVLTISQDGHSKSGPVNVFVTISDLKSIDLGGPATLNGAAVITTDSVHIVGSGGSQMELRLNVNAVRVDLSGASSLKLCGNANRLSGEMNGASRLGSGCMEAKSADIETTGAAYASVTALETVKARASGASDIIIYGDPKNNDVVSSGASSIETKSGSGIADTTHVKIGGRNIDITEDPDERSAREKKADDDDFETWGGMDFGVNGLMTYDNQLVMPEGLKPYELNYLKSYVFGFNMFQKNIHLYRNNLNLGTGIGLTWYHFNMRNSYSLQPNVDYTYAVFDSLDYSKNRLNVCYANVPLFLEFNSNNSDASHSFHIGAGAQFGYNIFKNKLKQKYELEGKTYKRKLKDDFNVNPFKVDLIGRIGYGNYTLFASYSLTQLFEKDKGPALYPVTAGIHIDF